jgi:hypothetical protein
MRTFVANRLRWPVLRFTVACTTVMKPISPLLTTTDIAGRRLLASFMWADRVELLQYFQPQSLELQAERPVR